MGFFQDLKQDLSQTVNDLGIKDEADELKVEEESTTTASEDLFGSASDTDFGDLESMLEKEVAALGATQVPDEKPDEMETTSDVDLEALLSDIEIAEKDEAIADIENEIQSVDDSLASFEEKQSEDHPESILDGFSFDDIKPIDEEPSAEEEVPTVEDVPAEEKAPIAETSEAEISEEELLPIEEEMPIEEISTEEISTEEPSAEEIPTAEVSIEEELPPIEETPVEEIVIPEEPLDAVPETDENNNSEADEDMEQLLNEVEQNIQEHTYMDEAPATVQEDSSDINVAVSTDTAVITAGMNITGDVTSSGNMDLIGSITGNIEILGKLNVTGSITGNSAAAEVYAESAQINGEINSKGSVKIGQSSVVIGNIFAKSAVIAGAVKGDIDVHGPVILDTSAIVMGNIKSKSVQINNGAVIEGMCSQCYADVSPTSFFNDVKKNRK